MASAALSIYHLVEAHRWEKYGSPPRYSWSHGDPQPWWNLVARALKSLGVDVRRKPLAAFIWRFAEPLVCLIPAIALYPFSKALRGLPLLNEVEELGDFRFTQVKAFP